MELTKSRIRRKRMRTAKLGVLGLVGERTSSTKPILDFLFLSFFVLKIDKTKPKTLRPKIAVRLIPCYGVLLYAPLTFLTYC